MFKIRVISKICFLVIFLDSKAAFAADFALMLDNCKMLGAGIGAGAPKTVDSDKVSLFCKRNSKVFDCTFVYKDKTTVQRKYQMEIEAAGTLLIRSDNWSDVFYINYAASSVVSTTRFLSENLVGAKVCSGYYVTSSEMEAMQKSKDKTK